MYVELTRLTRKALQELLAFLESDNNRTTGEEFGHPSPREIFYEYIDEETGDDELRSSCCVRLVSILTSYGSTEDEYGINGVDVMLEVAENVVVHRGGLSHEDTYKAYPVPDRIMKFVLSLDKKPPRADKTTT